MEDWSASNTDSIGSYDDSTDSDVTALQIPWLSLSIRTAVNLFIPFVNGIMLGFGEILAHELGLSFGWRSAKIYSPPAPRGAAGYGLSNAVDNRKLQLYH